MTIGQEDAKPTDPFEAFRGMRDAYLDSMSKVMINSVNTEEYAQATGAWLDGVLTLSAPVRDALDKAMVLALERMSLPSRQQVVALAERFTNVEMRLDDLDAKLDRIVELTSASQPPAAGITPEVTSAAGTTPELDQVTKDKAKSPQQARSRKS